MPNKKLIPNIVDRRNITFEQAEGLVPLPAQMRPRQISDELRAQLYAEIYRSYNQSRSGGVLYPPWASIIYDAKIYRDHLPADEFQESAHINLEYMKDIFFNRPYGAVFGFLEFVIRHPAAPRSLPDVIEATLERCHAAYRIYDRNTIGPFASEEEANAISNALKITGGRYSGAKTHLKTAIEALNKGHWAQSVRESISAVESVALVVAPGSGELGPALKAIEKKHRIHGAMVQGFRNLYGYTSDENGIRHSLLESGDANVDEVDATYMLGVCASFVTYLISRAK